MNYYKVNYEKLKNINEINYFLFTIVILFVILYFIFLSFFIKVKSKIECFGIISDNILKINLNSKLSDKIKNSKIKFKDTYITYEIENYGEYEIIDNEVYQIINLKVDANFYDNEVGLVTIYYNEISLWEYILSLFK